MIEFFESETSWLTLTNIALGVVTLAALVAVARTAVLEIADRVRAHERQLGAVDDRVDALLEGVHGVERFHGEQPPGNSGLIGGHRDTPARLRQLGNRVKAARNRAPLVRVLDVLVAVVVDGAVTVEDDEFGDHGLPLKLPSRLSQRLGSSPHAIA